MHTPSPSSETLQALPESAEKCTERGPVRLVTSDPGTVGDALTSLPLGLLGPEMPGHFKRVLVLFSDVIF